MSGEVLSLLGIAGAPVLGVACGLFGAFSRRGKPVTVLFACLAIPLALVVIGEALRPDASPLGTFFLGEVLFVGGGFLLATLVALLLGRLARHILKRLGVSQQPPKKSQNGA